MTRIPDDHLISPFTGYTGSGRTPFAGPPIAWLGQHNQALRTVFRRAGAATRLPELMPVRLLYPFLFSRMGRGNPELEGWCGDA